MPKVLFKKGHKHSESTKQKLRASSLGRKHSEATKAKMRSNSDRLREIRRIGSLRKTPYTQEEINAYIINFIKNQSLRRGEVLQLTDMEVLALVNAPCHYCGGLPRLHKMQHKSVNQDVSYRRNGIDRKDSSEGYTLTNVVPCCSTCNLGKGAMSYDSFIAWVGAVYTNFHKEKQRGITS